MMIPYCHICDSDPTDKRRYGITGFEAGDYCPVCNRPFCGHHGGVVRWRWRRNGEVDSGRVCIACKITYRHREWDPAQRDWIS
jgi:hypothetical protein